MSESTPASRFAIGAEQFELDGEPVRILSGALHYFRVHPDLWRDRIRKAREMGLNTIETYVAWNAHAPHEDEFDLSGGLDLGRFLDDVAAEGMHAIVRPGPYICAEWDNGGLPSWLFTSGTVGVRRDESQYLAAVQRYLEQLAPVLVPRQIDNGGPIILVQIENEYGAYGSDPVYLEKLVAMNRGIGLTVPFTTVDQPTDEMLANGSLPSLHKTGSFGSRSAERLATLREHQPTGPLMCSEFWDGWFDFWGAHHHTTSTAQSAADLDELLALGASVNIYMFHGGTNFGFTNGANDKGVYQPIVTSYDYDAPLDEAGFPTAKYWAFREVLAKYNAAIPDARPSVAPSAPAFRVPLTAALPLDAVTNLLGEWVASDALPTMDALGLFRGFALYRTEIDTTVSAASASASASAVPVPALPSVLELGEVRDRAIVRLNGVTLGVLARDHHDHRIALPAGARGTLDILVEDQGRVDYGPRIGEPKGLIGPACLNGEPLHRWTVLPLALDDLAAVADALAATTASVASPVAHALTGPLAGPAFGYATFDVDPGADLYLDTRDWGKGAVWVNGFNLGRYWSRGPQHTLIVPAPVLRPTGNTLVVLELHAAAPTATFVAAPDLGHTDF
ncbi:glycoside hydrolase family 35 protein [Herbiconiux sp. VKM Ac-2851]|uniref:glycoside hydrolase family 35 protein n=1 Tax=Herbiconiux sp. VKM Ac-2851 TaxID=2739025 RepID=UPI001565E17D|nr:glycoside hydrolase family 35 protein [Herbiconiux sp. VKM Ac-2851]NQX35068.1 beta-galactosidase [Herbiconiux sp. VKM Ac-2851]